MVIGTGHWTLPKCSPWVEHYNVGLCAISMLEMKLTLRAVQLVRLER